MFTYSDSRITWFSQDITVSYWAYYLNGDVPMDSVAVAKDFTEDGSGLCFPIAQVATQYKNGTVMNYTGGMCGFKY